MKRSKSKEYKALYFRLLVREAMSLDVMEFLKEEFLDKYKKLQSYRTMIDAPLCRLFDDYHSQLEDIDIASLQGEEPDLLYILNCAVDDCLVEYTESHHSMAKRSFRRCRKKKGLDMKILEDNFIKLKSTISKRCGSSVSAPHKAASIPLLNYKVHGFEDQFEKIVKKISTASDHGCCAVGIVGIGGSGKTTLASMVFNAREVREKYQFMIWASLTSTLNKKESTRGSVFMEILSGVQNNDSLKTMLQKIKSYQGGAKIADHVLDKYIDHFKDALKRNSGKYLLVLDDVWETEYWFAEKEDPKPGKPKCILSLEWIQKTGGTIVVTSRLEEMADNIVGKRNLYMISPVSDEACFEIFLDRATKDGKFTREDEHLKSLKKMENGDKCFGLPLAACAVADIFVAKHSEEAEKAAMKKEEAVKDKIEAEGEGDTSKPKAEAEGEGSSEKDKIEKEDEGDTSKPETEEEGEGDTSEADEEREGSSAKTKTEAEGEGDASKPKAKDKTDAEGEGDASKPRAEADADADADGSAAKDKTGAAGEGDASKPRAEADAEGSATKDKTGAAGEAGQKAEVDASEPKVGAETYGLKAKLAAEEAKADASVKETAPEPSKAEEQAETEVVLPSDIAPPRKLAQRVMKALAFRKARETKRKTSEAEPSQ